MVTFRLRKAQKGQGLVEYATIVSCVAIISIVILSVLGFAVSRNYAVVASVFGGKKNPPGAVTGLINTISVETVSPQVTCHVAPPTSAACTGAPGICGSKGMTYVSLVLYASPDIQVQDLAFSVNNVYVPSTNTGSAASYATNVVIAQTPDAALCGNGIVITGKKAIAIVPIQTTTVDQ